MKQAHQFSLDALQNVIVSCLLCFFTGFLYSLGVFSTSVEAAAIPEGSLDGVWSAAMGLLSASSIPAMFSAGVFLSNGSCDPKGPYGTKTKRGQLLAAVGSICYALLVVGGYGVGSDSPNLIRFAFCSLGAGYGLIMLQALELLAGWVPQRPGLAVGIGQLIYGIGALASSSTYNYLLQAYSTANALCITAALISLPVAAVTPLIKWPPTPTDSIVAQGEDESRPLLQNENSPLTFKELVRIPAFWIYFYVIFSLRAGMAFVAYFFKIGSTFGTEMSALVIAFQAATIAGTLSRPITGAFVDIFKAEEGFFSSGAKNVILILLLTQSVSFLALIPASVMESFVGFAFFAGVAQAIFAAGSCCIPLLAREQFGTINSTVVFGTGGSLAAGLGEIMAVWLLAFVEGHAKDSHSPTAYQPYYFISFITSISGMVACLMVRAQKNVASVNSKETSQALSETYSGVSEEPVSPVVEGFKTISDERPPKQTFDGDILLC